jgi:hypothetical protein
MAGLMADPTGITNLANATDDMLNTAFQSLNNVLNQQVNQMLDVDIHYGPSQSNIQELTDYFYPNKEYWLIEDQIKGKVYSQAVNDMSSLAQSYIDGGMNQYEAIAKAVNQSLPDYYENYQNTSIPADGAMSIDELLDCDGVVCRHYSLASTAVAKDLGLEADRASFRMEVAPSNRVSGHAITLVKNSDGSYGVIDATNPYFTNNSVDDFLNQISSGSRAWTPITDIEGALYGYKVQILD